MKAEPDMWPPDVRLALERMARDVAITSPLLFRVADEAPEMALSEVTRYPNERTGDPLVDSLTERLYARYYCRRQAPPERDKAATDLQADLQRANTGTDGWDSGWEIVSREPSGAAVVRSGARTRLVEAEHYRDESGDGRPSFVALRRRREDLTLQPDYYYAFGDALGDRYEDLVGARIYLNVAARAAADWTARVTRELNHYRIPFAFKVLRHAAAFERVDTCIVYVARRHAGFAAAVLLALARGSQGLRSPTPLFARRLGAGIALADNPARGVSFGLNRMRLVAEGIVLAWREGETGARSRLRAVATRFRAAGLKLHRPWLNTGNTEFALAPRIRHTAPRPVQEPTGWIDVADRLGARLVRDAIWHRDQCTWLGWSVIPGSETSKPAVCTAGGDLYAGTSGIALFLARLAAKTQDGRLRATALAALRHAMTLSRRGYWPIGAYSGLAGLLHGAAGVSDALESEEAHSFTQDLLRRLEAARPRNLEVDVIEGRAGAILTLLHAARRSEARSKVAARLAVRLGEEIIRLAVVNGEQWSWPTTLGGSARHLLGYSHGTAGIAAALYELARATGDARFLDGADRAWRHEWSGFDAERNNWPDLRPHPESGTADEPAGQRFMAAWCSGAPGTALALARRFAAKREPVIERHLRAAETTILASLQPQSPEMRGGSFCLCHGIAGNAEIALQIHDLAEGARLREAAMAAAHEGVRRHHDSGSWPCGIRDGGESPGLLLGLAGIGHFYLRLADASIASPLAM